MPGRYDVGDDLRPAHIHFKVTKAGYKTLITQMYFKGDSQNSPNDPCGFCRSDAIELMVEMKDNVGNWTIAME